jgi:signal transduction histidine kinase
MKDRLAGSLGAKLLAGQLLVVFAGAGTLLLIALSIGPAIFRRHIVDALGYVPPDVGHHLDMAFNDATLISLGVAVAAAVLTALLVSSVVSVRVVRPVRRFARAAQVIAGGAHDARVPVHGHDEIAQLAGAFNDMAASLERAEEARRQLLADVAHELRNPLATVESYLEAMSDGVLPADTENWKAVRAETARLNRLVDDLQEVARADALRLDLHPRPTQSSTLLRDAVKAASPAYAARDVELAADLAADLPWVDVDGERLTEALSNLLANALRHTPGGGRVVVAGHRQGDAIEIAITDSGEGIAPEHLDRVFERFYRVDPARSRASGGSGLGLAIVRAILEAHGGTVSAASDGPGHGATFTIRLPIHDAGASATRGGHSMMTTVERAQAARRAPS